MVWLQARLPRCMQSFLPKESLDWYKFISTAINDLYAQLQRMKDQEKTPSEFGLQVRSHPGALMVTARNKEVLEKKEFSA